MKKDWVVFLFGALIMLFFMASCQSEHVVGEGFIQKRKYRQGYHFLASSHNNKAQKATKKSSFITPTTPTDALVDNKTNISVQYPNKKLVKTSNWKKSGHYTEDKKLKGNVLYNAHTAEIKLPAPPDDDYDYVEKKSKRVFSWIGFGLSMTGAVVSHFGLVTMLETGVYFATGFYILGAIFALVGLIFGLIGVKDSKGFGMVAIVVGSAVFVIDVLVLFFIMLLF